MEKIDRSSLKQSARSILISFGAAVVAMVLLFLFAAGIVLWFKIPLAIVPYISIGILALSCLIGGYINAKLKQKRGIICGIEVSALITIVLLCISAICKKDIATLFWLTKLAVLVASGILGGILGVNSKGKRVKY